MPNRRAHNFKDLTGQRFGALSVMTFVGKDPATRKAIWACHCDCGEYVTLKSNELRKNRVGCSTKCRFFSERISECRTTHGLSDHKVYTTWATMRDRCTNPNNKRWKDYGGRGIGLDPKWMDFAAFWEDVKDIYVEGMQIDRKNNDLGYFKSNIHFVTPGQNCSNKRNNRKPPLGAPANYLEIAKKAGLNYGTLKYRLKQNWSWLQILSTRYLGRSYAPIDVLNERIAA